jgi:predicted tellurium resistance membrane protein TerC
VVGVVLNKENNMTNLVKLILFVVVYTGVTLWVGHEHIINRIPTGTFVTGVITIGVIAVVWLTGRVEKEREEAHARTQRELNSSRYLDC